MDQTPKSKQSHLCRNLVSCYLALVLVVVISSRAHAQDKLPSWTNNSGRVIEAEFVRLDGDTLVIRKDGKVFNVPLSKLAPESQIQAKKLSRSSKQKSTSLSADEISSLWEQMLEGDPKAILKLSEFPTATTEFLASKLRPVKMTREELLKLLSDLGSQKEDQWRRAYKELVYTDPRLVMGLEELFKLEQVQKYPARHRLVDLLTGYSVDWPLSATNKQYKSVVLKRYGTNGPVFNVELAEPAVNQNVNSRVSTQIPDIGDQRLTPEIYRYIRSIVLLESFETPEANKLLNLLASGHPKATLTKVAQASLKRLANSSSTVQLSVLWSNLLVGSNEAPSKAIEAEQAMTRAVLTFKKQPLAATKFLATKLKPIKTSRRELGTLLQKLASDVEGEWRSAYEQLAVYDPRLEFELGELLARKDFQDYPARHRLIDLLTNTPIDRRRSATNARFKFVTLEEKNVPGEGMRLFLTYRDPDPSAKTGYGGRGVQRVSSSKELLTPQTTRLLIALSLLESFNTPEAKQIIKSMATGNQKAILTQTAYKILDTPRGARTAQPTLMGKPVLAAYSFTDKGTKKASYSPDLALENVLFENDGLRFTGQCYYYNLEEYEHILKQSGTSAATTTSKLDANAFSVAMQIKPNSFPVSKLGWGFRVNKYGSLFVGGSWGQGISGFNWFELLTDSDGKLYLVLDAQQRRPEAAIDLGVSLSPGRWQNVVVSLNTKAKSATVRVDKEVSTVKLPEDTDVQIIANHIRRRFYLWSFSDINNNTAFDGHVKFFAILNGDLPLDKPIEFPPNLTPIDQDDKVENSKPVIALTNEEENLRQLLHNAEQSPVVNEVGRLLATKQSWRLPQYYRRYRDLDQIWQSDQKTEEFFNSLNQQLNSLELTRTSETQSDLSRWKLQDSIANGIGYLFFCAKRVEMGPDANNLPELKLPKDFSDRYQTFLQNALRSFEKYSKNQTAPQGNVEARPANITESKILARALSGQSEEDLTVSSKPSNTELLQEIFGAHNAMGFAWSAAKRGSYDANSPSNSRTRTVSASEHMEKADKHLAKLIGVTKAKVLAPEPQSALESELKDLLRIRFDLENFVRTAKKEAKKQ